MKRVYIPTSSGNIDAFNHWQRSHKAELRAKARLRMNRVREARCAFKYQYLEV